MADSLDQQQRKYPLMCQPARGRLAKVSQGEYPLPGTTDHGTMSRRTFLIGAAGGAAMAAIGIGAFVILQQRPQGQLFTYRGHSSTVSAVVWSPDGQRIASASGDLQGNDYTVKVWNASDGSKVFTYRGHTSGVSSVAWSPDGQRIASGSFDNTVQVWHASDGRKVLTYRGHSIAVNAVAWSPEGNASHLALLTDDGL